MPRKIEISHRTIVFTVILLIGLWFIYTVRDILLQFFVALLIMAVLNPIVTKLSKRKIPRAASILLVYLLLLAAVSFAVGAIIPSLIEQTSSFVNRFPEFINGWGVSSFLSQQITQQLIAQLATLPSIAAKLTLSIFSNVLGMVAVMVFAFYLLSEREKLDEQLGVLLGDSKKTEVANIIDILEKRLGSWARAQLTLMSVIGLATFIGLSLLGIPFALPLAILAGLLEIVPYIGPILAAIPAVLIGFGISPIIGLASAALAFLVQQLENYILVPKIMQRSTGVNPVITLLALAIGFRLSGLVGLIISVPIFITLQVLAKQYFFSK